MRSRTVVRIVLGIAIVLAALALIAGGWYYWTGRGPGLPPKLAGSAPVAQSDLPQAWRGLDREAMARELEQGWLEMRLRAAGGSNNPALPATWQELLLTARYLDHGKGVVRALAGAIDEAERLGHPGAAIALARQAAQEAQRYDLEPGEQAYCWDELARLQHDNGLPGAALRSWRQAELSWSAAGDAGNGLRENQRQQILELATLLGDYDSALELLPAWQAEAPGAVDANGQDGSFMAGLWSTLYRDWGLPDEASAQLDQSAPAVLSANRHENSSTAVNYAEVYATLAELEAAERLYKHALAIADVVANTPGVLYLYTSYYQFLLRQGRDGQAQQFLADCLEELQQESTDVAARDLALNSQVLLQNTAGAAYYSAGDYARAKQHYAEALRLAQSTSNAAYANPSKSGLARVQNELGEYAQARKHIGEVIEQAKGSSKRPLPLELARLWIVRGRSETGLGQLPEAQRDLDWAAKTLRGAMREYWPDQREAVLALGELAEKLGQPERAREHYQAAFDAALAEARALSYSGYLQHDYAAELKRVAAKLEPLLLAQSGQAAVDSLRQQIAAVATLREIALGQYQLPSTAGECLARYRTAQTREQTLRNIDGQLLLNSDLSPNGWWRTIQRSRGVERQHWLAVRAEAKQRHVALTKRIAQQAALASQALVELNQLDPKTAALLGG